jgi:hypothetical protein
VRLYSPFGQLFAQATHLKALAPVLAVELLAKLVLMVSLPRNT